MAGDDPGFVDEQRALYESVRSARTIHRERQPCRLPPPDRKSTRDHAPHPDEQGPHQPALTQPPPDPRAAPPPSALPILQAFTGNPRFARLTNDGPPLLSRPEQPPIPPERVHLPLPRDDSKHNFPRFDGECPRVWLDRCLAYFELYRVPPQNWVATGALYVEGHVAPSYEHFASNI